MGDSRTYEYPIVLRAVTSVNGMTADWCLFTKQFYQMYPLLLLIMLKVVVEVTCGYQFKTTFNSEVGVIRI